MNTERLQHLLHIAKNIDMERLDMGTWGAGDCGSVACLAGWAARDPDFKAQGLVSNPHSGTVGYNGEDGFPGLDHFFDLHGLETTHLFSPVAYSNKPTRVELMNHINDILAGDFREKFGVYPAYLHARSVEENVEEEIA